MPAKLIVTDLDGTLWDHTGTVHPSTRSALAELERRHVPVMVATARRRRSVLHACQRHDLVLGGVLIDGALGYTALEGDPFHRQPLTLSQVAALVTLFAEYGHEPMFETDDPEHDVLTGDHPSIPAAYFVTSPALRCDLASALPLPVFSAVAIVERGVARHILDTAIATSVAAGWVDLNPAFPATAVLKLRTPSCTKWSTVVSYCEAEGISPRDVVAIGDDDNDVELLRGAGVGLAMATASPAARQAADHIVRASAEGGWAAILDYL